MSSPMYPGGPGMDEVLAYQEVVSGDKRFSVFSGPATQTKIRVSAANLAAINVVFVAAREDRIARGQMVVERPALGRDELIPRFMADYERVVTPLQEEVDAMSEEDRLDLSVFTARAAQRVLDEGRGTLAAFALFTARRDYQYGGLFVPEPMMGDSPQSRELGPKIAAHILPRIDRVRQGWELG